MMLRVLVISALVAIVALAVWHPAPGPAIVDSIAASAAPRPRRAPHPAVPKTSTGGLVYVVGAVVRPGLYRIAGGARVDDAVRAAGGLRADADPEGINLAAYTADGDEILVPMLGQVVASASGAKRSRSLRSRAKTHGIVDVNTAPAHVLASVPGIGDTIAARIVAIREQDGAYQNFDQLLDVAGMTQSRLDRARPYLRL
ncbi:MAG TPA: helix-hairpin-helix domain-containing protein [Candidatus Acidoferrales bacterium]|nr:helix-hairpin-helix domain-containing protein [Candidatus Acidoferrales bacterium]